MKKVVAWWRYVASVLIFIVAYFLLPPVIGIALAVTNLFSPEFYKSSEMWMFVLSDILSVSIGFSLVEAILLKQKYVFQAVFSALVAVYSFLVAVTNWTSGFTTGIQFLGVLSMGVVSLVFVGVSCKKHLKEESSQNTAG